MKRLTIPGSGTESRATKPARVSAPATLGGAAFGASREDTGADLLEAAQAAEIEQQADPPPLKWSKLMYCFWHQGGPHAA